MTLTNVMGDFYEVLGVSSEATQEEIRAAYRQVIRECHPDVDPSPQAAERFFNVQEAFRWLSDPQQREVYDGVGSKFGGDALYDYTDEPILGTLDAAQQVQDLFMAPVLVTSLRKMLDCHKAVRVDLKVKCIRQRYRKYGAERIVFARDYFLAEIRRVLLYTNMMKRMHPFERLTLELGLMRHYEERQIPFGTLIGAMKALRTKIHEEASARIHLVRRAERGRLATFHSDEAVDVLCDLVEAHTPIFQQYRDAQKYIRYSPIIDLDKPTVVFVGAPNVGKSSLVRSISTGQPTVANYCYTTKELTVGHLWHFVAGTPLLVHGQIVDSPGLTQGPGGNFNLMEQLTFGSLQHLPTAVVFVFDPQPELGGLLAVEEQIKLRESLRRAFPKRPWLDVITKTDHEDLEGRVETLSRKYPDALQVSAFEGTNLDLLNSAVRRLLEEMTRVLRQLQRAKIRMLRMGADERTPVGKEALPMG